MASKPPSGIPRPIEGALGFAALLLLSPLLAAAALAVKLSSPGPVFFRQTRMGQHGRPFTLLKFRTMSVNNSGLRITAADDPRITRVGRLLRRTKIDELPQLTNLVCGDIALVGPRPEVPDYVDLSDPLWRSVLAARPGITDPVTLRLRNEEDLLHSVEGDRDVFYRETLLPYKLRGNLRYLENRNWKTDVVVILRTLLAVVTPERVPSLTAAEVTSCLGSSD